MPVVVVIPMVRRSSVLAGVLVSEAIDPFAQIRLDEALDLAAGLGPPRAGNRSQIPKSWQACAKSLKRKAAPLSMSGS